MQSEFFGTLILPECISHAGMKCSTGPSPRITPGLGRPMVLWWRQRKERKQRVIRDADNLMALFGERAYFEALARARHENENGRDSRYWLAVRREIAGRIGKEIGLDTATRYLGP